jgi:hypothetical protein
MLPRHAFLVRAICLASLVGCAGADADSKAPAALARPGIQKYRAKQRDEWGAPSAKEILAWFGGEADDTEVAVRILTQGLRDPDADFRADAAYLLGYLHDSAGRGPLVCALEDEHESVRLAAGRALVWIKSPEAAERVLLELCRNGSSLDVRITAAEALGKDNEDTVAAFRLGLASQDEGLRDRAEGSLERMGKLTLPLPEQVYREVSREEYERLLEAGKVQRQVVQGGAVFFEVTELVGARHRPRDSICALDLRRFWYRTPANK